MSRIIVSPLSNDGVSRFMVNSDKIVGLVKLHSGHTKLTTKVSDASVPVHTIVAESFEEIFAKLANEYPVRAAVTPVDHPVAAKFVVQADKVTGLMELDTGNTILAFRANENSVLVKVEIEESFDSVFAVVSQ